MNSTPYYPKSMVNYMKKIWKNKNKQWRGKRQSDYRATELFQMESFVTESEMDVETPPKQEEGIEEISRKKIKKNRIII